MRKSCFVALFVIWTIHATAQIEFIGMEYQGISNRTYIVFVSDTLVWGGKVQGPIAAGVSGRYPDQMLDDPYFYADPGALEYYRKVKDPRKEQLGRQDFVYKRSDIDSMTFTDERKWGMGDVRYTGRIFMYIKGKRKREFILLGKVSFEQLKRDLGIEKKD